MKLERRAIIVLVAALLGSALTARLGVWQLDRAAGKVALRQAIDARGLLPTLGNEALASSSLHRRVVLTGHWLAERTVLLDNRPMDSRQGFYVLTPLQLDGRAEAVLVQRGWVPRNSLDRKQVPPFATPSGEVQVTGRVTAGTSHVYEFAPSAHELIRQNLDVTAYAQEIHQPLLPLAVQQTEGAQGSSPDGLTRDWPAPDLGLQMHYGYAFQWFALCALILGLYVWFQLIKPRRIRA